MRQGWLAWTGAVTGGGEIRRKTWAADEKAKKLW